MYRIVYTNVGYDSWPRILEDYEVEPLEITNGLIAEALYQKLEADESLYSIRPPAYQTEFRYRMLPLAHAKNQPHDLEEVGLWTAELLWESRPYGLLRLRAETSRTITWDGGELQQPDRRHLQEFGPILEDVSVEGYSHHLDDLRNAMNGILHGFLSLDELQSTLERPLLPITSPYTVGIHRVQRAADELWRIRRRHD